MFWNFVSALDAGIHVLIPKFPAHLFKLVSHSRQLVLRTKLYIEVNVHNRTSNIIPKKNGLKVSNIRQHAIGRFLYPGPLPHPGTLMYLRSGLAGSTLPFIDLQPQFIPQGWIAVHFNQQVQ